MLAEVEGKAVGHILPTKARLSNGRSALPTLASLSVTPEFRGRGNGRHLVEAAHGRAAAIGFGTVVLIGPPGYYRRFGYRELSRYPIALPFDAPDENCMILALTTGALDGVAGMVDYADGWLCH